MSDETARAILTALAWVAILAAACTLLVLGTNP